MAVSSDKKQEEFEVFLCLLTFNVALFFLAVVLLASYFVNGFFLLAAPCLILVMYLSYRKGKGEKIIIR